jgi:hypothetical protein
MAALIFFLLSLGGSIFKSRSRLEAENAALRQQLIVLQRKIRGRVQFTNSDRLGPLTARSLRVSIATWHEGCQAAVPSGFDFFPPCALDSEQFRFAPRTC